MQNQQYNPFFNPQMMNSQNQMPQSTPRVDSVMTTSTSQNNVVANPFLNYSALSRLAQENNSKPTKDMAVKPSVQTFNAFEEKNNTGAAAVMTTLVVGAITVAMATLLIVFGTNRSSDIRNATAQIVNSYEVELANLKSQNGNLVAQIVNPQLNSNVLGVSTSENRYFSVNNMTSELPYSKESSLKLSVKNDSNNPVELYIRFDPKKLEVTNKSSLVSSDTLVVTSVSDLATVSVKTLAKGELSFTVIANDGFRKSAMLNADGTVSYLEKDVILNIVSK